MPPRGGPRAELPGGNPKPRVPAWSDENANPQVPAPDTAREHRETDSTTQFQRPAGFQRPGGNGPADSRQGPGSTEEFARPDFNGPRPDGVPHGNPSNPVPPAGAAPQRPQGGPRASLPGPDRGQNGAYPPGRPQAAQPGQAPQQGHGSRDTADFALPRPPQQPAPQAPQSPDDLPPAGPGDGRTPLYDTLETNWFRGQQAGAPAGNGRPEPQQPPQDAAPQQPGAAPVPPAPEAPPVTSTTWRTSPNDELVRQAERVKQPTAGGVTTSGLPRRVPRANLVAGTAEQQQHQGGPQVSRAPDEVRGRLTKLRRGIQQGRDAGTGQTGSFPRPSHQQER
ncbi:hypothetical protein DY218_05970 [Streptomyces triticagri]|uniref:Histidine kinase n=1 Tax=Streptomyces triticagri TaxID=2293568 RepID=A0A372MAQ7_9ACTN|nr:hypothetical protein DY218_05970 [Streptomyces triticagri]